MNHILEINISVILTTWLIIGLLCIMSRFAAQAARKKETVSGMLARSYVRFFLQMVHENTGSYHKASSLFIAILFTFICACNYASIIPGLYEPTENINTTLALSLISFFYIQSAAIKAHGFKHYCKEYIEPFFLLLPLHVLGKLSSILSMACRLFGNISGGAMITGLLKKGLAGSFFFQLGALITGLNLLVTLFFGVFEGFIQAFVFTMLTSTYLAMAVKGDE